VLKLSERKQQNPMQYVCSLDDVGIICFRFRREGISYCTEYKAVWNILCLKYFGILWHVSSIFAVENFSAHTSHSVVTPLGTENVTQSMSYYFKANIKSFEISD
jgi:hypothetical protein